MKIYAIVIVMIVFKTFLYGQGSEKNSVTFNVRSGMIQQTTNDRLLNYYSYSGNATIPISLSGSYRVNKNFFALNLLYYTARLNPLRLPDHSYEYNYIEHRDAEFKLEYFREVVKFKNYIQGYIGLENSSYFAEQTQNYSGLFYPAEGFRKSYDASIINLSPMISVNFRLKKNSLIIKAGYSLLQYAARPDDDYVKQIGLHNVFHWSLYNPEQYKRIFFSAVYQYEISNGFGIALEYTMLYRTYTSSGNYYKYLRNSWLLGVFKTF